MIEGAVKAVQPTGTQPGKTRRQAPTESSRPTKLARAVSRSRVVTFVPRRREKKGQPPAADGTPRCVKCDSIWVVLEPAFIHCKYCGAMNRITNASLAAQEEFEIRSGLRLAS